MNVTSKVYEARMRELFRISDQEGKGFIVKRDMQRMLSEVPLSAEQLEDVFHTLDEDNNGYLTVDTFLRGFGSFLSNTTSDYHMDLTASVPDNYQPLLDRIASTQVLENTLSIRRLCDDVTDHGSNQLHEDLEAMLIDLLRDLKKQKKRERQLEEATRRKDEKHSLEMQNVFEEMEFHLKDAKSKMATQIEQRLKKVRSQLEDELAVKNEELNEVTSEKRKVSLKLHIMKASEAALRRENAKLSQEKQDLEASRDRESREVKQLRQKMTQNQVQDQNRLVASGFRLAQRILAEEKGLLQQLRILKSITKTLEEDGVQEGKSQNNSRRDYQETEEWNAYL